MFSLEWYLFAALPEALLLVFAGTLLLGLEFKVRDGVLAGAILSWLGILVRSGYVMQYIKFGTHSIIITCFLIILNKVILRVRLKEAAVAGLISVVLVALAGHMLLMPVMRLCGLTFEAVLNNPGLRICLSWVELVFLLFAVYLAVFKKVRINLNLN